MSRATRVQAVIQSAWQRRLVVLSVEQLALALAVVLAGAILMLLLGTQILSWYWLLLLMTVGIALAAYRIKTRLVGRYRVAQLLDQRLQLSDSLSTAWFLLSLPEPHNPVADFQLNYAEQTAAGIHPTDAFPLTGHRLWAISGALAAVAFGLFALRYLVTDSLSMRQPIVPIHLAEVLERVSKAFSSGRPSATNLADSDDPDQKAAPSADGKKEQRPDQARLETPKFGQPNGSASGQQPGREAETQEAKDGQDGNQESRAGGSGSAQPRAGEKADQQNNPHPDSQPSAKEQPGNDKQPAGLIDRMKDALSSLMAKVRPGSQKSQPEGRQSAEDQKSGEQASSGKDSGNSKQDSHDRQSGEQQQSSEGQAQGQTTEKTHAGQGSSSNESAAKKSPEAHSGAGRQDGDKDVRETEQLKAMGKLAEIIGKRSANVTGEMMVENPSGKQQLKTEYSQRLGHHADLGGEINRDEIPLADQQYVREYMEQVRKQTKSQ